MRRGFDTPGDRIVNGSSVIASVALGLSVVGGLAVGQSRPPEAAGFLGVLVPQQEITLEPPIEGELLSVLVRIGDRVKLGQVVAELDREPIQRQIEEADARLEEARAAEAEAVTKLAMGEETLDRQQQLAGENIVSKENVRRSEQERDLLAAALDRAKARVKQQEALKQQLEANLSRTRIVAPFTGTVAERYGNPGMLVAPGTPVVKLIASDRLWVRFAVPVEQMQGLALDRPVRVTVSALDLETAGTVTQIGSEVDPASGMLICEATVEAPLDWQGPPLAGQAVRVFLTSM